MINNRAKLLFDFLTKKEKTEGLPLEIGVEVINICNLRCIMCPYEEMVTRKTRPQGKMSDPLFKKIIDEVAPFAELIYLHGLGEPLLHPKIFEFIKYAKKKGLRVGISTNAMLLDKTKSRKLLDSGIDYVILAMDGATKEIYEKIRVGGKFEQVEQNIRQFLQLKKERKRKPFTVIQFITMAENEKEVDLFSKKWQRKGANVVRIKPKIALKDKDKQGKVKVTP
jgi:MoaA/NifB/PqqE/SkfB family radical SAM enzyme